ncbi:hypothetical protein COCMIDRAFT_3894 [Bipolaris oryzae ATCC 44560]|uniref:Uncharacterized protein n=1 Tax=Bipolaris oryzae ATCC 44560 TaxID=930090 RepID=W6ZHY9_COCMI|nr:uncharacterized protein COCMIDRAFT_3894 [Bipolaris oryzae ATCC 44560]EUC47034.1 hypothetical protein COCMIDRAFT_3894 [Bipolaris oryzae ATCC 44560]
MSPTKKPDASVPKPKPVIKKVKVVNKGSEIKQMAATVEAARKSAASSSKQSSIPNPVPQNLSGSTQYAPTSGRILIGKNAASRIRNPNGRVAKTTAPISQPKIWKIATGKKDEGCNASSKPKDAVGKTAAPVSQSKVKKIAVEKKGGVNDASSLRKSTLSDLTTVTTKNAPISQPKTKKLTNNKKDGVDNASSKPKSVLPGPATEAAITKRSIPLPNLTLRRMTNKALESLKERRWIAQTALDGLFPLMKTKDAIEIAVAALEQQIDDCNSDIQQLKRLPHSSHAGDIKPTDFKDILALASLVSCNRTTDENNKLDDITTKAPKPDIKRKQVAEEVDQTRPRDEALNVVEGNHKPRIKPPTTTKDARRNRLSPTLDEKLFGPDLDLSAPTSCCTSPSHITDARPTQPNSKAVSVPRTHKPSNAPTACSTENVKATEPTKNDKLHTVDTDNHAQTQTEISESTSSSPKNDVGGGIKPGSRASSEGKSLSKEKGVEDKRSEKRKHEYIEAEDAPNKKVHLSGQ